MTLLYRVSLILCVAALTFGSRAVAQEALDSMSAEPTPIRERSQPAPPAEGESEAEATPHKKKAASSVGEMSPEEFKRAGLDKLSPEELKTLNEWMRGYKHQAETRAAAEATEQAREQGKQEGKQEAKEEARAEAKKEFNRTWLSTDRIYSRIEGQFHGLGRGGKKILIVLEDGTVWKQANEMDRVNDPKLVDNPPVMITHSMMGYKMHVIGAGEFWVNPYRPKK